MYIIGAILAFGALILIHELGHFTLAKLNGVRVEEFSIGMGPKLFGIKGKETEYLIKALPIGGYVKMLGEDSQSEDSRAFTNKAPLRRLSIIAAGPIMNIVFAVVLFAIVASLRGFALPVIDKIEVDKPAAAAGLQAGDKIIKVNNKKIVTWEDFVTEVYTANGSNLNITFLRNEKAKSINITPVKDPVENRYIVGVYPTQLEHPGFTASINYGFIQTNSLVKQTFGFLKTLIRGKASASDVGGPLTIIKISGEAAKAGIISLLAFAAYISVQLAIFNIIPFPALDGGLITLILFELITRKKIDQNKVGLINYIGFAMLMALMIIVTIKDILYPIKF